MRATFLGHGLNSENPYNVGKQLAKSFDSKHFDNYMGFVAFAATSGIYTILKKVNNAKERYKNLRFYIGVDNKGTSKEALELLVKEDIETYIYYRDSNYITYHPKLFVFEGPKYSRIIIGSSNLTNSGLKTNVEASIQIDYNTSTDKQGAKLLTEIKEYYSEFINLTDKNLKKLDSKLIDLLDSKNLLYSQYHKSTGNTKFENQTSDGDNNDEDSVDTTEFDINSGFEPIETIHRKKTLNFTKADIENFEHYYEIYKIFKQEINNNGIVGKNYEDKLLYNWYRRLKELLNAEKVPKEYLDRLLEVDFPFTDGKERKRLEIWDLKFEELLDYKLKFQPNTSYTHVPQFKDNKNPYFSLGTWCAFQKQRKKGNYCPPLTEYELDKLESIKFLWDSKVLGGVGSSPKDDDWADSLVELEEYYNDSDHYKTIPHQKTTLGKWLNTQLDTKLNGTRNKNKKFLNPLRAELLGDLLKRNGVEWEWQKQKEREAIESLAEDWRKNRIQSNYELLSPKERKKYNDNIAAARYRSKRWPDWKRDILIKAGMSLPEKEEKNTSH